MSFRRPTIPSTKTRIETFVLFYTGGRPDPALQAIPAPCGRARRRAAGENVQYLELMTSAGGGSEAAGLGSRLGWDDNLTGLF